MGERQGGEDRSLEREKQEREKRKRKGGEMLLFFGSKKQLGGLKTSQSLFCERETGWERLFFWGSKIEIY